MLGGHGRLRFNTSLVRLAPLEPMPECHCIVYVSIPAWFDWRPFHSRSLYHIASPCFNTSLVRLARLARRLRMVNLACFNTSLVRLALLYIAQADGRQARFNTSLVRLAPRRDSERGREGARFQYQLGSIGARPR